MTICNSQTPLVVCTDTFLRRLFTVFALLTLIATNIAMAVIGVARHPIFFAQQSVDACGGVPRSTCTDIRRDLGRVQAERLD